MSMFTYIHSTQLKEWSDIIFEKDEKRYAQLAYIILRNISSR